MLEGQPTDQELVRQTLAGDDYAFEMLVERHQQAVYRILYRLLKNRQEAEDIAQETFLRCYRHLAKFDQNRAFAPWLYRIATNLALSRLQRLSKRRFLSWDGPISETQAGDSVQQYDLLSGSGQDRDTDPEAVWERKETSREIFKALENLKPTDRLIVILRYCEELSCEEIAYIMKARRNNIEVRLFRAKQKLRGTLAWLLDEQKHPRSQHQKGEASCTPVVR
jgi:RNA polymerase sigma-70 factor (ECF subfamily)